MDRISWLKLFGSHLIKVKHHGGFGVLPKSNIGRLIFLQIELCRVKVLFIIVKLVSLMWDVSLIKRGWRNSSSVILFLREC